MATAAKGKKGPKVKSGRQQRKENREKKNSTKNMNDRQARMKFMNIKSQQKKRVDRGLPPNVSDG